MHHQSTRLREALLQDFADVGASRQFRHVGYCDNSDLRLTSTEWHRFSCLKTISCPDMTGGDALVPRSGDLAREQDVRAPGRPVVGRYDPGGDGHQDAHVPRRFGD